jgi:hypothetical protein
MISGWMPLVHPLELYGVLALTGSCLLYAFTVHLKMRTLAKRGRERHAELESRLARVAEVAEQLRTQLEEVTRPSPVVGQPLNLNKRGQVLRMRRRGENPETIAAALAVPRNEVDLLLKVHQLAQDHVESAERFQPA